MALDRQTAATIVDQLGLNSDGLDLRPVGGGDIAEATLIKAAGQAVFVKTLALEQADLLAAEADGLAALEQAGAIRVPRVLGQGESNRCAWLALEALDLRSRSRATDARLGRQLAELHRRTGEDYGWSRDNFIGLTPQSNATSGDWSAFFGQHRLGFQMELLARRHAGALAPVRIERVLQAWETAVAGHQPAASLLHGDLWSGNAAALANAEPVMFDPAVHYGDRECDLAMTALFGGFSPDFYQAYNKAWPLPAGWQERRSWYQLYHLLNHANLFAGGYLARVRRELAALGR